MDQASQRDLRILTEISERQDITQRGLSKSLGIALGLTNLYLKRLARKGSIKVNAISSNRITYLLTPQGISEKTRLTYEYITFSLALYKDIRQRLREAVSALLTDGPVRVGIYGTGEAAELAYLTLRELGLEPVAVFEDGGRSSFLGMPVLPTVQLATTEVECLIVASFLPASDAAQDDLRRLAPAAKLVFLENRFPRRVPSAPRDNGA